MVVEGELLENINGSDGAVAVPAVGRTEGRTKEMKMHVPFILFISKVWDADGIVPFCTINKY